MKTSGTNPIDKTSVYVSAGLLSGCGVLLLNVMPVFVGVLAEAFSFSESELGDVIASYNIAFTLIAISALAWVRKVNWRMASVATVVVAVLAMLAMTFASSFIAVALIMFVIGCAVGAVYAVMMVVLGDSDDPDRAYGLKLGLETCPGVILLFLIPAVIAPKFGFDGVIYSLAITMAILCLSAVWLPKSGLSVDERISASSSESTTTSYILSFASLFASFVYSAGLVAAWAFLELLATAKGLPGEDVGTILAGGFIICGIGGFVAAAVGDRWGRILPFAVVVLINLVAVWLLMGFTSVSDFAIATCTFLFTINFGLAYTFGLTAEVDRTGKLAVLSAAVLSIGAAVGPMIAGRILENSGATAMLSFSAVCSLLAFATYFVVAHLHGKAELEAETAAV